MVPGKWLRIGNFWFLEIQDSWSFDSWEICHGPKVMVYDDLNSSGVRSSVVDFKIVIGDISNHWYDSIPDTCTCRSTYH